MTVACGVLAAVHGVRAETVSAVFSVLPRQETYYVGQRVTARITINVGEGELHGDVGSTGMPGGDVVQTGAFRQQDSGRPGVLVFAADMILIKRGVFIYAPEFSGQIAVRMPSRGFVTRRIASFRTTAPPLELNVALPPAEGRPEAWTGIVGEYRLDADVTPRTSREGDLLTLKWSLVGRGTVDQPTQTAYDPGPGFRVYPPRVTSEADGVVSCAQVVIPLDATVRQAAAFEVPVFNPVKGAYETLSAGPFPLTVRARASGEETNAVPEWVAVQKLARESGREPAVAEPGGRMRLFRRRQGVRLTLDVASAVRLAPSAQARVLFDVPAGAPVYVRERQGDWARVLHGGVSGWMPAAVLREEP